MIPKVLASPHVPIQGGDVSPLVQSNRWASFLPKSSTMDPVRRSIHSPSQMFVFRPWLSLPTKMCIYFVPDVKKRGILGAEDLEKWMGIPMANFWSVNQLRCREEVLQHVPQSS